MRLLVVSNLYPPASVGGYETRCADTVDALREHHEILVLTSRRGRETAPADPRVRRVLPYLRHHRVDSLRAPLAAWQGARAMRSVLAEWRPDLIFVWNAAEIPHSALWVAQQSGVPLAFSVAAPWFHNLYAGDRFARHLDARERGPRAAWGAAMRLANHVPGLRLAPGTPFRASVCWNSEATRALSPAPPFVELDAARVIYPATRAYERFAAARRRPRDGEPLIAFAGRLEPQKGPDIALRALAHMANGARLELAGGGDPAYRDGIERLAYELGVADRVHVRGPLDREGVVDLFERADVLVVPSTWQEPFGMVCVEAALAGVPVVASRSGGMPEALREGSEAVYFGIGDWRECARAVSETLADPDRTTARTERARARAEEFSFERYAAEMERFVEEAAWDGAGSAGEAADLRRRGVLLVEQGGRGGVADYTGCLAAALAERDVPVVVATARDHLMPPTAGVRHAGVFTYLRGHSAAARLLRRLGAGWIVNGLRFPTALPQLARLSRRAAITHVQGWERPSLGLLATLVLRAAGARLVYTAHNTFERRATLFAAHRALPALSRRTIVHTEADLARLDGRATLIPHGHYAAVAAAASIPDRERARAELGLPAEARVALLFGNLRPDKGVGDFLEALEASPGWHGVVAGEDHGALAPVRDRLGSVIVREGFHELDAVAGFFAAADVVVLPYRRASQSGVLHLAYGFGRPAVAYPVGGLLEAIVDGRTGWLCAEPAPSALAATLAEIDPAEALRRGEEGRRWAEERFSWDPIAEAAEGVYLEVLSNQVSFTTGRQATGR